MPEHIQYEDDELFNAETKHESTDVPVKGLLWFLVIFVVFSFVTWAVILFFYKGLVNMERKRMDPPQSAVTRPKSADVPQNQPLLQPFPRTDAEGRIAPPQGDTPVVDLVKLREAEDKVLKNYGWVDKEKGLVHIPIDEAKARFVAQAATQGQQTGTIPAATTAPTGEPVAPSAATIAPTTTIAPATTSATTTGAHQ